MTNLKELSNKVYEAMADKTLSCGCLMEYKGKKVSYVTHQDHKEFVVGYPIRDDTGYCIGVDTWSIYTSDLEEYIGHPLHIGYVLDWVEENVKGCKNRQQEKVCVGYHDGSGRGIYENVSIGPSIYDEILSGWIDKTKPIPLEPTEDRRPLLEFLVSII